MAAVEELEKDEMMKHLMNALEQGRTSGITEDWSSSWARVTCWRRKNFWIG